jgi:hypothetical protein
MADDFSPELAALCADEKKFILRALQYCQDDATPAAKKGWYYIDASGNTQGPFPTDMMKKWHAADHFHDDLMVRNGDNGVFTDLASLGANPFDYNPEQSFKDALTSIEKVLASYQ